MEQKYQAVLAVIRDGVSIIEVANRFGVSRQSVHSWLLRYELEGMHGLTERSHRPDRCEHQMSSAVQVRVIELRRQNLYWEPKRIQYQLLREGADPLPSVSEIYRALQRAKTIEPGARPKVQAVGARRPHGVKAPQGGKGRWHFTF